jgi:hypothetical protein
MKCIHIKPFAFMFSLLISGIVQAQSISIQPVELSIKRPDINRQNEETELVLSFQNIGREFLQVKSFHFLLKDDQGTDMIEKGGENLQAYEKKGFFTSRSTEWEYFNYGFYNQKDAFGGRLIVYCAPSPKAKQLVLKGEDQVWVKGKSDKTDKVRLSDIIINTNNTYHLDGGGAIKFVEKGRLSLDNSQYKNYKIISDVPIASVTVEGQRKFQGIATSPDEIFVNENKNEVSLIFEIPNTQLLTIPVDINIGIGL